MTTDTQEMTNKIKVAVGDPLFVVYQRGSWGKQKPATWADATRLEVTVVGRKWVTAKHPDRNWDTEQFDLTDGLSAKSYSGRAYLNEQHYNECQARVAKERARGVAWDALKKTVGEMWRRPDHLTTEDIETIIAKLKGPQP